MVRSLRSLLEPFFNLRLLALTNAGVLADDAFGEDIPVRISPNLSRRVSEASNRVSGDWSAGQLSQGHSG
jgi:hypothetical protein